MESLAGSANLRWLLLCIVEATRVAAPSVTKVEPANLWGFKVEIQRNSENGHYLFAYITIDPSHEAGAYRFEVKDARTRSISTFTGRRRPVNSNRGE